MNIKDINTIISKYLDDQATVSEKTFLLKWIKKNDNRRYFEDFIKTQAWVAYNYDTLIIEKQLTALSIDVPIKERRFRKNLLKYAALLVILFSTALFLYVRFGRPLPKVLDKNILSLEINDGSSNYYSLEDPKGFSAGHGTMSLEDGGVLRYRPAGSSPAIHTIHVPNGRTFTVVLADGSVIQLNSGSRFSYPASFDGQNSRSVSLVGEGYFNIAKSDISFRVNTENLTTEVLGTEFNISAYEDDAKTEVILVAGFVQVFQSPNSTPKNLVPNQKATTRSTDEELLVETINIKDHLGWTDGVLVFYEDNMATIFKKLERKFNIHIENNYEKLESLSFNGRFSTKETLEEVLGTIRAHTDFSYTITATNALIIYEPDNPTSL